MIASFTMDAQYFREDLSEWTSYVSKGRRFEPYLSELLLLFGIALLIFLPDYRFTGIAAVLFGLYGVIVYHRFKHRWMRDRLGSKTFGKSMVIEFKHGEIHILEPEDDRVSIPVTRVRIIVSKKGYFICPKESLHLYVPFSSFSPPISRDEALAFIQASHGMHPGGSEPHP
ncbi:MAG TPA: hypothetical protein PKM41_14075 [Deltaproteobacteria bacterium]|nr:hypothetical protein [Deltaproteobacteria bacterium]